MNRFSIDIADWNGRAFRRVLRSADRFSDRAIRRGSFVVKTPRSRSSASLRSATFCDHRRAGARRVRRRGVVLAGPFRDRDDAARAMAAAPQLRDRRRRAAAVFACRDSAFREAARLGSRFNARVDARDRFADGALRVPPWPFS
jgi:hypothetical protein